MDRGGNAASADLPPFSVANFILWLPFSLRRPIIVDFYITVYRAMVYSVYNKRDRVFFHANFHNVIQFYARAASNRRQNIQRRKTAISTCNNTRCVENLSIKFSGVFQARAYICIYTKRDIAAVVPLRKYNFILYRD